MIGEPASATPVRHALAPSVSLSPRLNPSSICLSLFSALHCPLVSSCDTTSHCLLARLSPLAPQPKLQEMSWVPCDRRISRGPKRGSNSLKVTEQISGSQSSTYALGSPRPVLGTPKPQASCVYSWVLKRDLSFPSPLTP